MLTSCSTFQNAIEGVGVVPQHQSMGPGYDFDAANSVHKLWLDALPDFEPNFNTVIVHSKANLTDLIGSVPIPNFGYIVSAKLADLLKQFALPVHRFYPLPMKHRGKAIAGYSWLHLPQPQQMQALTENVPLAEAAAAITSVSELAALDMLRLYRPARLHYCFVSGALRHAIESTGITGVRFGTAKILRSPRH